MFRIAVCAKQVVDPEIPPSQFRIDEAGQKVVPPQGSAPVVNGFDLNATEAALQVKEALVGQAAEVTVISAGGSFALDVMKKPLSMGADRLVLVDDVALTSVDAQGSGAVLAALIKRDGPFDLVLCGRQASDWDQGLVPAYVAERLRMPLVTQARSIKVAGGKARVERALPGARQTVETELPAVITVSNEIGEPRYPTLRGIMTASKKAPVMVKLAELGLTPGDLADSMKLVRLYVPDRRKPCEFIQGKDDAESGQMLALRLRQEKLI